MERDVAVEMMEILESINNELRIANNLKAMDMGWSDQTLMHMPPVELLQSAEFSLKREVK